MVAHLTNLIPVCCRQEMRQLLCPPYSRNKFNIQRRVGQIWVSFEQSARDRGQQNSSKFLSVLYSKEKSSRSEREQKIKNICNEAAMAWNYITCILIGKMLQEVCKMFGVSLCCLFYSKNFTGKKYTIILVKKGYKWGFYKGSNFILNCILEILFTFLLVWITYNFFPP